MRTPKRDELEEAKRIMGILAHTPPKPHKPQSELKVGKGKPKAKAKAEKKKPPE